MRPIVFIFLLLVVGYKSIAIDFDQYFERSTLRIDYIHAGNDTMENFYFEQLKQEPYWSGSPASLIDPFNYGEYRVVVYAGKSDTVVYTKGYCTLFEEWRTTREAALISRSFYETVLVPFPKRNIRVEIQGRDKAKKFVTRWELEINPDDYFIRRDLAYQYPVLDVYRSGKPSEKVDVVIIPDGYNSAEMEKFEEDAKRFAKSLLSSKPYDLHTDKFNFYAVLAPSQESGTDIPGDKVYKNTLVSTTFYTFDSERYLMTYDVRTLRDIAALTSYDQIYILVNTKKYGGGAIYNYYNVTCSDHPASEFIFNHEFGHGFAGLGDEYYDSEVAYEDFFDLKIEPWQPNLTTLVDFESKWKALLSPEVPVPTPSEEPFLQSTGVFEGGGYVAKGVYRPAMDCTMKSNTKLGFCEACRGAIEKMIGYYCNGVTD